MNTIKHQHYVPQFYLRNFCNKDDQIYVYDKKDDKSYLTSPRNTGGERYFYDCEEMAEIMGDKQAVEKFLSSLEDKFSPKINRLLYCLCTNNYIRLHSETRSTIAVFAAFQIVRSKESRITSRQMSKKIIGILSKYPRAEKQIDEFKELLTDEQEKSAHCKRLLDLPLMSKLANIIENHIWIISKRHIDGPFWASDQAITRKENVISQCRSNAGIASPGIEIHIPLSSDFLITCYERKHFSALQLMDGKVVEQKTPENTIYYRQFQVRDSLRFVYSNEPDFDFAKRMCEDEPMLRDENRKRIITNDEF